MMNYVTGLTRGKKAWTPKFVASINEEKCIGCGRCIKICAHGVLAPVEAVDEYESSKVCASIQHVDDCIGCEACGRTCRKQAFSFEPLLA
jgi:Nif-specific ferredoxin III